MQAVWASQDREALRKAIWSHLTEVPAGARREKRQRLAYAFEMWIAHLALLEQLLEMTPVSAQELQAAELDGLLLLRAAREQFRREYRACGECGAAVKGKICPRCGAVGQ